jgi:hypothetical protein
MMSTIQIHQIWSNFIKTKRLRKCQTEHLTNLQKHFSQLLPILRAIACFTACRTTSLSLRKSTAACRSSGPRSFRAWWPMPMVGWRWLGSSPKSHWLINSTWDLTWSYFNGESTVSTCFNCFNIFLPSELIWTNKKTPVQLGFNMI